MTDKTTTTPAALAAPAPDTRTDLALCPIRVGDQVCASHDPALHGQVTYISDYSHDGLIECLVELPGGHRGFAPPWGLRPVDGDQDSFAAQIAVLVAAQRITAARVLRDKQQRTLTVAQQAAQALANVIDDLEHDRIPIQVGGDCDITELDDLLREATEFREVAIALDLLDPPDQAHLTTPETQPAL